MGEDWDNYWNKRTFLTRAVDFARTHYFSDIPLHYLGNINGKTVLEPGCGTCESLVKIAEKAKKVTGLDISRNSILLSKNKFKKLKIPSEKYSLVIGNICNMEFEDGTFDIVFNTGVIEHFDDDKINNKPVEEMIRVTKKDGKIVILVPSTYSLFYFYYLVTRLLRLAKLYPWEEHRFYTFKMLRKQLNELNVRYKIKLNFKSLFLYIVAEIIK